MTRPRLFFELCLLFLIISTFVYACVLLTGAYQCVP